MSKYSVQWTEITQHAVDIEADGPEEAVEVFRRCYRVSDPTLWDDTEVGDVDEPQNVRACRLGGPL